MSFAVRLLVYVVAVAGVLVAVLAFQPVWLASLGLDSWTVPAALQEIDQANQRFMELEARGQGASARINTRWDVVEQLIEETISLREAVARFRALNAQEPSLAKNVALTYPAATEEAAVCQQVLTWVKAGVSPDRRTTVMARLDEEAAAIFVSH